MENDDPGVLKALSRVLRAEGWMVQTFESAEAFVEQRDARAEGCLVLDVSMPGPNGLELQQRLAREGGNLPIGFLTGHGDIAMERAASEREARAEVDELKQRYATLTPREREVLAGVTAGRLNKQIAADLGITEQTVKFHRARIMERMQARTAAELMHIAARLASNDYSNREPSIAESILTSQARA